MQLLRGRLQHRGGGCQLPNTLALHLLGKQTFTMGREGAVWGHRRVERAKEENDDNFISVAGWMLQEDGWTLNVMKMDCDDERE